MTHTLETQKQDVARGARYLDWTSPDWYKTPDGELSYFLDTFKEKQGVPDEPNYGFCVHYGSILDWTHIMDMWKEEAKMRCEGRYVPAHEYRDINGKEIAVGDTVLRVQYKGFNLPPSKVVALLPDGLVRTRSIRSDMPFDWNTDDLEIIG